MIKASIHQERHNPKYIANNKTSECKKPKTSWQLQVERDLSTIILVDFNTPPPVIIRTSIQQISNNVELDHNNNTWTNMTTLVFTKHYIQQQNNTHTHVSSAHETFTKTDHILDYERNL